MQKVGELKFEGFVMIIIGLGNRARQGKDTAGEAIVQHFNYAAQTCQVHSQRYRGPKVALCKFARALYKECEELHDMTVKDPVLLQNVGMQRREEDSNYWIKRSFDSIPTGTDIAVFTDVRFLNEAARIKAEGGHLIEVVRLNQDGSRYYTTDRPNNHPSEIELDGYNWDYHILSKSAALTAELAITIAEYIRGLESK
jgi:hypothetical protein